MSFKLNTDTSHYIGIQYRTLESTPLKGASIRHSRLPSEKTKMKFVEMKNPPTPTPSKRLSHVRFNITCLENK